MTGTQKDTIYVDIDDDITAIIDKVNESKSKVIALVLPKRAATMQSLVNMQLLKRSAEDSNKNLVLITNESRLMPLAAAAGMHVAATPTSKPVIPAAPDSADLPDLPEDVVEEPEDGSDSDFNARENENKPIGEVAGLTAVSATDTSGDSDEDDGIEFDNSAAEPDDTAKKSKESKKESKSKKLKIPNFKKFRLWVAIVVLVLIGLGVLAYFATQVWPNATIKIYTDQKSVPVSFVAQLNPDATNVDPSVNVVPAVAQTQSKSYSQTVPASGKKDEGKRASGSVQFTECVTGGRSSDIPSGTGVSTNNLTYITQESAHFSPTFQPCNGGVMAQSNSVDIVAQHAGENYNVSSATFQVSGSSATGNGDASGGTSKIVRVVAKNDVATAKQKLQSQDDSAIQQTLESQLKQNNLMPLTQTYIAQPSDTKVSASVGDEADNVTVTQSVTYIMYGVKKDNLSQLIKANIKSNIDSSQGILEDGLAEASFKPDSQPSSTSARVSIDTTAIIGPKLNKDKIAKQAMGKRAGEIRDQIGKKQGVSKVEVNLSPFWVGKVPNKSDKVVVKFEKTNG